MIYNGGTADYIDWVSAHSVLIGLAVAMTLLFINSMRRRFDDSLAQNFFDEASKRLPPKEIRCLSYNIFLRPPFIKNNSDDFKNERFEEFCNILAEGRFDVIALQEIFPLGNLRPSKLIKVAKSLGYNWYMNSRSPFPKIQKNYLDGGLLILSRYPLSEHDHFVYTRASSVDSWVAKQVIYVKVHVSRTSSFHFFTTHMQASYLDSSDSANQLNDESRLVQVDEMAKFIHSKVSGSALPALITGDFNVNAKGDKDDIESAEYKYLIRKLNNDLECCTPDHFPVEDLLKSHTGIHPNTYADVHPLNSPEEKHRPRETILTDRHDLCTQLCIDYMMFLDCKANRANSNSGISVKPKSTKVEEFFLENHPKVTQISDHYGISTVLTVNQDPIARSKL